MCAAKDEPRYIDNPYPDYSEETKGCVLDPETDKIKVDLLKLLHRNAKHLLSRVNYKSYNVDSSDYTVYTGLSGIGYVYFHVGRLWKDESYMTTAQTLFESSIKEVRGRRFSFLCGDPGPLALYISYYVHLGSPGLVQKCVDQCWTKTRIYNELLYGRAGYLYALLLIEKFPGYEERISKLITNVIQAILTAGKDLSKKEGYTCPLMFEWHDKKYIGAAHGLFGIFHLLLEAKDYLQQSELNDLIRPTIDYLLTLQFPSGNFPSSMGNNSDRLVHWCHGAPGAVYLFAKAHQVFGSEDYLKAALRCGDVVWKYGLLKKGYGLCHGVAGNTYAFIRLYQVTKDPKHLYRACKFAEWMFDFGKHGCRTADRPLSLYEGLSGTAYLLADLMNPDQARFPGFQLYV